MREGGETGECVCVCGGGHWYLTEAVKRMRAIAIYTAQPPDVNKIIVISVVGSHTLKFLLPRI